MSHWRKLLCSVWLGCLLWGAPPSFAKEDRDQDEVVEEFNRLVREYRFPEALVVLNRAVTDFPGNPVFPMQLVSFQATIRAYVDGQERIIRDEVNGNPGRALRAAQRILSVQPDHRYAQDARNTLGEEVLRRKAAMMEQVRGELARDELDAARETVEQLLALDPLSPSVRALLEELEAKSEHWAQRKEHEARLALAKIERPSARNNVAAKSDDITRFQKTVEKALSQRPGDEKLLALAKRGQEALSRGGGKDDAQGRQAIAAVVVAHAETPEQQLGYARKLLAEGRFAEAEGAFTKLTRVSGFAKVAEAYIYQGIARLASAHPSDVVQSRQLQLRARASFVNALRFDPAVALPAGYEKYAKEFAEARQIL